jgi:hypothetical protein
LPSSSSTPVGESFEVCITAIDQTDETNCETGTNTKKKAPETIYIAVPSFAMTDFVDNTGNSFNQVKNEVNTLHHIRQED